MQHGPAASSGSNPKAPGSAGGYLLSRSLCVCRISRQLFFGHCDDPRQADRKRGAPSRLAVCQRQVALHEPAQFLAQDQAKAGSFGVVAAAEQLGERLE